MAILRETTGGEGKIWVRLAARVTARGAGLVALALLSACVPQQQVRQGAGAPGAREAALAAIELEPGTPPPLKVHPLPRARKPVKATGQRARRVAASPAPPAPRYRDVWARVRAGLRLPRDHRARIERELAWYRRNQEYLDRMAERARLYLPYIAREVERRGMPLELALLPVVESAFQPYAYSRAGASGIWQFIQSTGKRYRLRQSWWYDARRDLIESTRAALDYLDKLRGDFGGDWLLAIAAYNTGEGNIERALARNRRAGRRLDFWSLRLPRETRAYVPRLLAVAEIVADPAAHGLRLAAIPDRIPFEVVATGGQIDLALAARSAGVSLDTLYRLNPGFHRFATDPAGPHRLLVPREAAPRLRRALASIATDARIAWKRHTVTRGESLATIARRYRIGVEALRSTNRLASDRLRAGTTLRVPTAMARGDLALSAELRLALARSAQRSAPSQTYVVRRGDSLWRIARRHRMTVARLAALNGISARAVLRPGQRLRVRATPRSPAPALERGATTVYVVRRGDNLSTIARRHGVSVARLASWNAIDRADLLRPGQRLVLKPGAATRPARGAKTMHRVRYTVRRGDSLWFISRRFKVSVASLRRWNDLGGEQPIHPGQTLELWLPASAGVTEG